MSAKDVIKSRVYNMRKRLGLVSILLLFLLLLGVCIVYESRMTQFIADEDGISIGIKADGGMVKILPWYDDAEELFYVFLPSCVPDQKVYFDYAMDKHITVNGLNMTKWDYLLWEENGIYAIGINDTVYQIRFMKSENIPAFFMETDSGSMDYIHENKENQEQGNLSVVDIDGHLQYKGKLDKISGRGNSTWAAFKKPYSITLHEADALCGLEAGKKWNLLALYFEQDKIHSKIIYDMAQEIGLDYTPECTWIDLYCNGEYKGLYLLTEAITIADGRVDGEYLIEKDVEGRIADDDIWFSTSEAKYLFTVKSPKNASVEQVKDIADFIQNIEDLLVEENPKYKNYVDIDSVAKKFLIDTIALDVDGMNMSMFFYKERGDDILYAGPVWDFDKAMGTRITDYTKTVESSFDAMNMWYTSLYSDSEFYQTLLIYYQQMLPYMEILLDEGIDNYVDKISASIAMDSILMRKYGTPNSTISYTQYDNYIRYLKYFLANRLNYLNSIWGEEAVFAVPLSTGEYHKVVFIDADENIVETRMILDGECVENIPALEDKYKGWYFDWEYSHKEFSDKIPIYEDVILQAVLND